MGAERERPILFRWNQLSVQPIRKNASFSGENLLGRVVHRFDDSSELQAQVYFDRTDRNDITARQNVETYDFHSQYRTRLSPSNEITLGASYRFVEDAIRGQQVLHFDPVSQNIRTPGAFIQDEIELLPSELKFTVGTKYEHNEFVGSVWQPDARLIWQPNERNSFWTAYSRAARTPALADNGIDFPAAVIPGEIPAVITITGNRHVGSEMLNAYQIGYRFDYSNFLTFDIATFYDRYTDIITLEAGEPSLDPSGRYATVPLSTSNLGKQILPAGNS